MTDTVKDQLIVVQSIELMQLKSSLALHKVDIENAARGQQEYKEILDKLAKQLGYSGNYHNISGILNELLEQFVDCGFSKNTDSNGGWHKR